MVRAGDAIAAHARVVVGSLLGLVAVTETIAHTADTAVGGEFVLVLCLLALGGTLPLTILRPAPAAVAISAANVLSLMPFDAMTVAGAVAQLIALYRLGRYGSQLLAAALCLPFLLLAFAEAFDGQTTVLGLALATINPLAAWAGATRGAQLQSAAQTADRQAVDGTLLEHLARGERARIARELHDVVAHHISMIAVQAEAARLTTAGLPADGAARFKAIGDTARAALNEMRRLLGVLREDVPAYSPESSAADRQPQPGLSELNQLLDESRNVSGTGTRLILRGAPSVLDPGVELAAYRIVQEALTNARRHAPGAAVDVELLYAGDTLRVRIRDNGPGPPAGPLSDGHGLLGMRERAAAVGGRLDTGPASGGGFLVETVLPAKPELAG
jgi:signal transduction histidine kinase